MRDAKGLRCRLNGQPWARADRLASFQTRSLDNLNELTFHRRLVWACQGLNEWSTKDAEARTGQAVGRAGHHMRFHPLLLARHLCCMVLRVSALKAQTSRWKRVRAGQLSVLRHMRGGQPTPIGFVWALTPEQLQTLRTLGYIN